MKPELSCPMLKKWTLILVLMMPAAAMFAQQATADTIVKPIRKIPVEDTSFDYEDMFQNFDAFMDSILSPHSYFMASISMSKGYYSFETKGALEITTSKKLTYSPTLGYYNKNGLGITTTGYVVNDNSGLNLYQYGISPSYDFLKNRDIATGFSYTKYITRKNLPFYTSPLQNELYGYFTYRKLWFRPGIAASYGWGSRSDYTSREDLIESLRLRPRGFTYINTKESISDFTVVASVKHDFYWLDVFTFNDHIRITPQISFTSGTQKFGFNQSSNTYGTLIRTGTNVLYSSESVYLDDKIRFQPLSLTTYLRGEYVIGKFFIQPQFTLDYYFPSDTKNLSTFFNLNAGFIF